MPVGGPIRGRSVAGTYSEMQLGAQVDHSGIERMTDNVLTAGSRGSIWRNWEPHIHAPGTVLADNFPEENGWELYLDAVEAASPALQAIGVQIIASRDPTSACVRRKQRAG